MRKFLVPTLLATALACPPLAFAATSAPAPSATTGATSQDGLRGMHHGDHAMRLYRQLDLTDTQRTNIQQMMRASFEQAQPEMTALREKRMAFWNATPGSAGYQAAASDLAQAESKAASAQVLREADVRTKIYATLTPEQRTKLAALRTERQQQMQQRRHARMNRHGPAAPAAPASSSP